MSGAKKISIFAAFLFAITFLVPAKTGHAQSQVTENMTAAVNVNSIFSVAASGTSLNFGNVNPGPTTTGTNDLFLFCESNNNNDWIVEIYLLSPLTSDGSTIPNEEFNFWGWTTNGSGTWTQPSGNHLDTIPHTFYNAAGADLLTSSPVELTLKFNIDIPAAQPVGVYTTSIIINMRDSVTAQEVEKVIYVTVGVNPSFSISAHPSSLDFSTTDPGTTTETKNLYIACSSNNGIQWHVDMNVIAELTSSTFTIPNSAFKWNGSTSGTGVFYPGTGYLSNTPFTFYEAGVGEYVTTSPVELFLNFYVEIPPNQIAGLYTTTLVLTMTE